MTMVRSAARVGLLLAGFAALSGLAAAPPRPALDSELEERTSRAYEAHLERALRAFESRTPDVGPVDASRNGVLSAGPAQEDGIIKVPGGLVHHWIATAFARGRTLEEMVDISRAYSNYQAIYRTVIAADVMDRDGDTYHVLMRLKESAGGLSAVLQIRSTVRYSFPSSDRADIVSNADEIREVRNSGGREELLPAGNDSGYLWRANTFTRLIATRDGVYMEMETLGLSRGFPPLLGWIIEPIARRIGRRSVEHTLDEFIAASATMRP